MMSNQHLDDLSITVEYKTMEQNMISLLRPTTVSTKRWTTAHSTLLIGCLVMTTKSLMEAPIEAATTFTK